MTAIPDPNSSDISSRSVVLGFAYSLTSVGLPGRYNEKLAAQLQEIISKTSRQPANDRPWIGMQWEIFDAIEANWDATTGNLLEIVPLSHVGGPPLFAEEDIVNVDAIVRHLRLAYDDLRRERPGSPSTEAGRVLAGRIAVLLSNVGYPHDETSSAVFDAAMFDKLKIAQYFNRILDDETFHQNFYDGSGQPLLELHDLYRANVGSVGVENRVLPGQESKLRRFQKLRVNRFIIEAIFPSEQIFLKPGKYLSTRGVLDQVTRVIEREGGRQLEHGFVYGHPEHSPRCRRQLIESGWAARWALDPERVRDVNAGREWEWDPTTAQMWCRSKKNWDDYERMGKARLD